MKTSTMLIITAVLVTLGCLTAFNIDLKKAYLTGAYRSHFKDMKFTPLRGIEKIDIQPANLLNVTIEYGDKEGIWINKEDRGKIKFKLNQNNLVLDIADQRTAETYRSWNEVIIVTRKINSIVTQSVTKIPGQYYGGSQTKVRGFHSDRLDLQIANAVSINLNDMQLNVLNATVGSKTTGGAELELSSGNKINTAQLNVPGRSRLVLNDPQITKASYDLSDSATVSLSGKIVKMIR